jgi:hypothetical protein
MPEEFQLRECFALDESHGYSSNTSFSDKYKGSRYRLRLKANEQQLDSVIAFIQKQDPDVSAWRSFRKVNTSIEEKNYWYCSLLVYQAFKCVLDIDLDANGGVYVFPNDIICSPHFDHTNGRIRF